MPPGNFSPQVFDGTPGVQAATYTLKYHTRNNLHYHDCVEIGLCVKGSGVCFVQQQAVHFVQGQITFVRSGEAHIFQSPNNQPSSWIFVYASAELLQGLPIPTSGVYHSRHGEKLIRILWDLVQAPNPEPTAVQHLVCALPGILGDGAPAPDAVKNDHRMEKILPALEYISHHYDEKLNIGNLAGLCYLSESFFRRYFREVMKDTPHDYLNRVRLAFAESLLLSTDDPILEISQTSGFESLSSFNRNFRASNGMSPREYRARNQLNE